MVRKTSDVKICLAASAGGHMSQLLKLSESWNEFNTFYITTTGVVSEKLSQHGEVHIIGECNHKQPLRALKVFCRCIQVMLSEKPDVVISTGAAGGCMACFLGKLLGAKVVWVDSITNIENLSLSGRMVRHIADLFLTQWPQFAERYENVDYVGTLI
jgi:UDP-N-acetylglucosamine:LPS N-acetylglucosamine transferase